MGAENSIRAVPCNIEAALLVEKIDGELVLQCFGVFFFSFTFFEGLKVRKLHLKEENKNALG